MEDIDKYQDDLEDGLDDDDGSLGDPNCYSPDAEEILTPFERLEKCVNNDKVFHRQMAARTLHEAMRAVVDEEDCKRMLIVLQKLADDTDPTVRSELMEQLPHLAMYCHGLPTLFADNVTPYMLEIVVLYITDVNNLVRKTSHAALLVLLEQQLVERSDMEEKVCPVIMDLSSPDSMDDFRPEAVALMSKTAQIVGRDLTVTMFLPRFAEMCTDGLFHVRKVCAANFGDMCSVVGQEGTESILLPKFHYLCEDGVWGVRKACAECFMAVSCACSLVVRRRELASLFINLICDQSRWVRTAAFQALGAFISTFADPTITGLYFNEEGVLVAANSDDFKLKLQESMRELDNLDPETKQRLTTRQSTDNDSEPVEKEECESRENCAKDAHTDVPLIDGDDESDEDIIVDRTATTEPSTGNDQNSDNNDSKSDEDSAPISNEVDNTEEVSMDIDTSISNASSIITIDVTDVDNKTELTESTSSTSEEDSTSVASSSSISEGEDSFNQFQFWKPPLANISDDLVDQVANLQISEEVLSGSLDNCEEKVIDIDAAPDMDDGDISDDLQMEEWIRRNRPLSICIQLSDGYNSNDLNESSSTDNSLNHSSLLGPDFTQDVIPQALLDHYLSMNDPTRAQTVDAEIAQHCAYSLPAVAYTLGRQHWPCIKQLYEQLAGDMQWKVRRTLAFSIHELAVIVGEDITNNDLVGVFNDFIKDLDEVRIGVLKHLGDFLRLLWPSVRKEYLHQIPKFLNIDNNRNWRFRDELALQLVDLPSLFEVKDVHEHLMPVALDLCEDKVATVRRTAFCAWGSMCSYVASQGDKQLLLQCIEEIKQRFHASTIWTKRQIYTRLCLQVLLDTVMPEEVFAEHLLCPLLMLSEDKVPNVRITVADTVSTYVLKSDYFTSPKNPYLKELVTYSIALQHDTDADVRQLIVTPPGYEGSSELTDTVPTTIAQEEVRIC